MQFAASDHRCALGTRIADMVFNLRNRLIIDQWALHDPGLGAVTDQNFGSTRRKFLYERIVD